MSLMNTGKSHNLHKLIEKYEDCDYYFILPKTNTSRYIYKEYLKL